jgi:hypothetical protein
MELPTPDGIIYLQLTPDDIRAPGYKSYVSTDTGRHEYLGEIHLFSGYPSSDPAGLNRLGGNITVTYSKDPTTGEEKLRGLVQAADKYYELDAYNGALEVLSPSAAELALLAQTVIDDVQAPPGYLPTPPSANREVLQAGTITKIAKIGVDADYEMFLLFGTETETKAEMTTIIAAISKIYEAQLGIKLQISHDNAWSTPNDPYTAEGSSGGQAARNLSSQFEAYWNANIKPSFNYDLAHLFTARFNPGAGVSGLATIGGICSSGSYGCTQ